MHLLKVNILAVSICSLSILTLVPSTGSANDLNSQSLDQVAAATNCELQNQSASESSTQATAELTAATNEEPQTYTELRDRQIDATTAQSSQPCRCPNTSPSNTNTTGVRPITRPSVPSVRPAPVPALW